MIAINVKGDKGDWFDEGGNGVDIDDLLLPTIRPNGGTNLENTKMNTESITTPSTVEDPDQGIINQSFSFV